eukprot:CAMPEP_0184558974 /NCGR_PEP_ID=MMETSP0199_2-20130426/46190_1 /TAXON_ID=1112570 /ORGANISM="Thraustochytrium sp., Strain LLF1b" /LENGTH=75 /DNA_ID=CAMNT_0026956249 /DNA_START=293 /DNA_END=520 /DNA_ORIENTATION=+
MGSGDIVAVALVPDPARRGIAIVDVHTTTGVLLSWSVGRSVGVALACQLVGAWVCGLALEMVLQWGRDLAQQMAI